MKIIITHPKKKKKKKKIIITQYHKHIEACKGRFSKMQPRVAYLHHTIFTIGIIIPAAAAAASNQTSSGLNHWLLHGQVKTGIPNSIVHPWPPPPPPSLEAKRGIIFSLIQHKSFQIESKASIVWKLGF